MVLHRYFSSYIGCLFGTDNKREKTYNFKFAARIIAGNRMDFYSPANEGRFESIGRARACGELCGKIIVCKQSCESVGYKKSLNIIESGCLSDYVKDTTGTFLLANRIALNFGLEQ